MANQTITDTLRVPRVQIDAARKALASPYAQERRKLGEAYGYYGERPITDTSDNPPAGRVQRASIDDDGTLTFTFEVFGTETGQQLARDAAAGRGHWVWAGRSGGYSKFSGLDLSAE